MGTGNSEVIGFKKNRAAVLVRGAFKERRLEIDGYGCPEIGVPMSMPSTSYDRRLDLGGRG